ncbi:MAG: hypothetical protein ACE5EE_03055 [Fidelibacterota bacterium]
MDVQSPLSRDKAAKVSHYLAFFYALIGFYVLLFGGFRFAIDNFLISATQLQNPLALTIAFSLLGKWLSPATSFKVTPLGNTFQAAMRFLRHIRNNRKKISQFWIAVLFLNFLLFFPPYLSHFRTSTFFPFPPLDGLRGWYDTILYFIRRENQDIFRLSGDFLLIISIWALAPKSSFTWVGRGCKALYLGLLSYQLYEAISIILFGQTSLIFDDLLLLGDIGYLIMDIMSWKLLNSILQIGAWVVIFLTLLFYAFSVLEYHLAHFRLRRSMLLSGMGGWMIVASFTFWFDKTDLRPTIQWIAPRTVVNIKESVELYGLLQISRTGSPHEYDYTSIKLKDPPDIFVFVIEAYGKILAEHPQLKDQYTQELLRWQDKFATMGWAMTSNYSEAPVSGGKSWLSVATLMCGVKVSNQTVYSLLLKHFSDYPHLVHFLQTQSFHSIILQPTVQRQRRSFDFSSYEDFYGYHRWIYYDDLGYTGMRFGWGIVPDQYSLNAAYERFIVDAPHPLFFLFTTVTSHAPWLDLPLYLDNWRNLNDLKEDTWSGSKRVYNQRIKYRIGLRKIVNLDNYLQHINYQFQVINDYITNKITDNSIVVIVGDHQPSIITDKSHGFQTPIHILSRDSTLVSLFHEYGFIPGLFKDPNETNTIRHEGFYSLLVRILTKRYSSIPESALPEYYPNGIALSTSRSAL